LIAAMLLSLSLPTCWALSQEESLERFHALLKAQPEKIWSSTIDSKLKSAIRDYDSRVKLKNGLSYGESVRAYSLKNKCPADVEADMKKAGCFKQVDVIKEPVKNRPVLSASGATTPIWQFVCPDGGVVKIKPEGDPSSRFTPFPHGSRVLRYPAESPYRDYRDEIAKVSEDGHIIPRGPADLAPKELVDGWSKDAHVPLVTCK
jgi:hypothetical protein